jgi:hypothetical protein
MSPYAYVVFWLFVAFMPDNWHPKLSHPELTVLLAASFICFEIACLREESRDE